MISLGILFLISTVAHAGWISPTSHSTPDGGWTSGDVTNAYDGSTTTYATDNSHPADGYGSRLQMFLSSPVTSNYVRVYSDETIGDTAVRVQVRLSPSGTWQTVHDGQTANQQWYLINFAQTTIDAAEFTFNYTTASTSTSWWLHELQVWEGSTITDPSCSTTAATSVEEQTAILHGNVLSDGGEPASVYFEYGTTTSYELGTTSVQTGFATGESFAQVLTGLTINTPYHYRAKIVNSTTNVINGSDMTFTTGAPPTGWVSPTSDTANGWEQTNKIYDDNTATWGFFYSDLGAANEITNWLTLSHASMISDGIRFFARKTGNTLGIQVQLITPGPTYTNILGTGSDTLTAANWYSGFSDQVWDETTFAQTSDVIGVRVRIAESSDVGTNHDLFEFDFHRVVLLNISGDAPAGDLALDINGVRTDTISGHPGGTYMFADVAASTDDSVLVYYIDAGTNGAAATHLEVLDPPTHITDLDLVEDALTVYDHYTGTLTTAELIAADGGDAKVPYSSSGTDITMNSGIAFRIAAGYGFDLETNTLTLTDDFVNNGTFTSDSAGGAAVVFAGGTGEISGSTTTTFPDLTISSGTLTGHADTMILAADFTNTGGTFVHNSGTIQILDTTTITEISAFGTLYLPVNTTLTLDTTDLTIDIENLIMENTGTALTVPDGSTITVSDSANLEGGPCCCDRCTDSSCGYLCYATIKTPDCGDTFDMVFQGSFVGSRVHFMNVGEGTIEFQGFPTSLSRINFTCGAGPDPWVRYTDTHDVTWDHLGFYQDGGDKDKTIEHTAAAGVGIVTVDIYANNKGWIGGEDTDIEADAGDVVWTNGTPVRQLTGSAISAENGGISVQWNTYGEDGVALFEVLRLERNGWEAVGTLPARGAWLGNAMYDFLDTGAQPGEYHEYAVNVVDIGGKNEQFVLGGASATAAATETSSTPFREIRLTGALPEATLEVVSGSVPTPISDLPRQWGTAKRAEIQTDGLYEISGSDAVYCMGNQLPVLPGNLIFGRAIKSFYTDTNVLWQGDLTFSESPAALPEPDIQGILSNDGFVGIFHYEVDAEFSVNPYLPPGPNWYFPSSFDLVGGGYVSIPMPVVAPLAGGTGSLIVNLRADTSGSHNLVLGINRVPLGRTTWTGTGHFRISVEFNNDDVSLVDGSNTVILQTEGTGSSKKLDYLEIRTEATPVLRDGSLLFQCETDQIPELALAGTQLAANVTTGAQETLLTVDQEKVQGLTAGALVYAASAAKTLEWQASMDLEVPDVQGIDYLALAPDDMLDAVTPLMNHREETGLSVASVAMSQVVDVFGCGIFDPGAVEGLSAYATPKYLLLASSTTYDYLNRENRSHPVGIPVGFVHPYEGLAATDDIYTNDFTTAVGRFPARTLDELENMVAKTIAYRPGRRAVLLAGEDGSADRFTELQTMLTDIMPTALIPSVGRSNEEVRTELITAIQAGARLVTYQGHAGSGQLDSDALISTTDISSIPLSSWLLSTCLTGSYLLDDWSIPVLSQYLLAEPDTGAALVLCSTRWGDMMEEHALVREALTTAAATQPTWGELVLQLKQELSSLETIKHYSLLGDPALETVDLTDTRQLALLEPLGGTVASTPDTVNIRLQISEEGWWKEKITLSERRIGEDWSSIGTVQLEPGQTIYDFAWTPPGDSLGYQILARQAAPEEGEPEQTLLEATSGVFDVDQTSPETPLLTSPSDGAYIYETVVRLRAESSDETTGVDAYQFEVNGETYAWQSEPLLTLSGIDNGAYTWTARARDMGGLISDWAPAASFNFYLDGDTDADGILDTWELMYFGSIDFSDGTGDADGDGATDWDEFAAETHPFSFSIQVKPGWSIVALPCEPNADTLTSLNTVFTGPFWAWDGTQYMEIDIPLPFQGFWAFATDTGELTVEGVLPDSGLVTLQAGWNLTGPGRPLVIPVTDALEYIWDWDGFGYNLLVPDSERQFQSLKGYWMQSSGGEIQFVPESNGD